MVKSMAWKEENSENWWLGRHKDLFNGLSNVNKELESYSVA
jgi:hypothetical protein